jgi:hypothetical protein
VRESRALEKRIELAGLPHIRPSLTPFRILKVEEWFPEIASLLPGMIDVAPSRRRIATDGQSPVNHEPSPVWIFKQLLRLQLQIRSKGDGELVN